MITKEKESVGEIEKLKRSKKVEREKESIRINEHRYTDRKKRKRRNNDSYN